jgi:hypothetical protein
MLRSGWLVFQETDGHPAAESEDESENVSGVGSLVENSPREEEIATGRTLRRLRIFATPARFNLWHSRRAGATAESEDYARAVDGGDRLIKVHRPSSCMRGNFGIFRPAQV